MHLWERVCRSVLFWQKTVRRGSRSGTPRPIAVRHGTDAHRPNAGGRPSPAKHSTGGPSSAQRSLSPLGDQIPTDSPHRRPTTGGSPTPHRRPDILSATPLCNQAPTSGEVTTCGHLLPANLRRPPVTDTTPSPSATQLLRRLNIGSRPSPTQRPLCHSLSPFPRQPSGASPNGRQKRSPSAGRGLNHLSMTNPQRGYLFSFRMRIACSRIVVSSNVTMPPSGPGSK